MEAENRIAGSGESGIEMGIKMSSNLDLCFKNLVFFSQPTIHIEPLSHFADPPADRGITF